MIEPHRIIMNNTTFLAFNYSNEIFIENISNSQTETRYNDLKEKNDYLIIKIIKIKKVGDKYAYNKLEANI